jgi:Ca2+-binding EF-hand superfamily protein
MILRDISRFFPTAEAADAAFTLFDRDSNGDISLEETEQACAFVILPLHCLIHGLPSVLESSIGSSCQSSILCGTSIAQLVVWTTFL